jgi:hypothetical protein
MINTGEQSKLPAFGIEEKKVERVGESVTYI